MRRRPATRSILPLLKKLSEAAGNGSVAHTVSAAPLPPIGSPCEKAANSGAPLGGSKAILDAGASCQGSSLDMVTSGNGGNTCSGTQSKGQTACPNKGSETSLPHIDKGPGPPPSVASLAVPQNQKSSAQATKSQTCTAPPTAKAGVAAPVTTSPTRTSAGSVTGAMKKVWPAQAGQKDDPMDVILKDSGFDEFADDAPELSFEELLAQEKASFKAQSEKASFPRADEGKSGRRKDKKNHK